MCVCVYTLERIKYRLMSIQLTAREQVSFSPNYITKNTVLLNFPGSLLKHTPKTLLSTPDELNESYLDSKVSFSKIQLPPPPHHSWSA